MSSKNADKKKIIGGIAMTTAIAAGGMAMPVVAHAEETTTATDATAQQAQSELDDANAAVQADEPNVNDAKQAKSTLDDAQAKLEQVTKESDASQAKAIEDAAAALAKATEALNAARTNHDAATSDAKTATDKLAAAKDAHDKATQSLSAAKAASEEADKALAAAKDAYDKAVKEASGDFAASTQAKELSDKLDAAKKEQDAANQTVTQCQKAVDAAATALASAQKTLDATPAADKTIANSSLGFFKWLTTLNADNEGAVKVLTDSQWTGTDKNSDEHETFLSDTHIGNADDATSLVNLRHAILYIIAGNEYRAKDEYCGGKPALKVSTLLMAQSEVNANWTFRHIISGTPHALQNGEDWNNGEIAAGGWKFTNYEYDPSDGPDYGTNNGSTDFDTPYDGWFLEERYNYIHYPLAAWESPEALASRDENAANKQPSKSPTHPDS